MLYDNNEVHRDLNSAQTVRLARVAKLSDRYRRRMDEGRGHGQSDCCDWSVGVATRDSAAAAAAAVACAVL